MFWAAIKCALYASLTDYVHTTLQIACTSDPSPLISVSTKLLSASAGLNLDYAAWYEKETIQS